jgi:hypothetical protein
VEPALITGARGQEFRLVDSAFLIGVSNGKYRHIGTF